MLLLKRISHAIILIVGSMFILPAHGALNLGDIVVLGVNSDAPTDQVTIMLLADIASGETIKITDRGWDSDSIAFYSNTISEGTITWTTTSSLTAGNVYQIAITAGSPATLATLPGTLSISGWVSSVMASGGDQWLIYQGSDVSPTFIYGFSNPSTNNAGGTVAGNWVSAGTAVTSTTSHLPSGLTNNTNAIALSTGTYHSDNMYYSGSLVATDKTTWLARITTLSNWTGNESTTYDISPGGAIFAAQETVTGLNSVPTTANFNGDSFTYTEGGGTQVLDQSTQATVTDGDSADFNGGNLTLTITSGEDAAEDILSIDTSGVISLAGTFAGNNISITGPGVIGTLGNNIAAGNDFIINLNASATPALVQTLVRALTYQNSDTDNPTTGPRNVRLSISDGDGGTSSNADITVSVVGSNDSPSINNLAGDNLNYSEGNGQQNIDTSANATVSDVDSTNFDTGSLTATILTNQDASEDILGFDNNVTTTGLASASITISATNIGTLTNAISEGNDLVITFNSNATPALVQSLLRAISYENSDTLAPTESTRTIRLILTDGDGGSSGNIDTTVVVSAINDLPVGTNNNLNPNESAVLTLTTSDFGYSDPEGDSLSYITITAAPVNGILWIDTDGSGTVNNAESALASNATISKANLDANLLKYLANGSTSSGFTFNVNDGIGDALANNTMTLTVNPRPTVAINQASGQADPTNNAAIIFDVLFNESVTGFDASDVSLNLDSGMAASVTNISGSGTTYQVTATITAGDGNISATVLAGGATDAGGATNKISGSTDNQITVDNTGPQIVSASLNTGNLKAGDTITAVLNFDETVVLSGSNSTATLDIGGTQRIATYLSGHNSSALSFSYVITTGEEDTDGVRLVSLQTNSDTAQDSLGNSATLSFTPITEANLLVDAIAPTGYDFSIDQSIIGSNATLLSFTITGGTDGDTYSYTLSDGITTLNGNGTLTGASHNVSAIDVSSLNETTLTLSLTLTDSFGNIGSAANDTVIKLYNAAPVMNQGTSVSITMSEDSAPTPFSLTLNATDIDTLSWSIGSNAANGSASVSGSNTSASINYTPTAEYFGSDSFIVAVTDGEFTTTTTVNVTITSVNDLPTITGTPATSVKVGNLYSFAPTTTDTDANPSLSCTITNKPAWASFNSTTGVLTGTPTADDVGTNSNIIISVTDGTDTVSLTSFNISVIAINSAPVASNASVSVDEDTSLSITPSVQDAEGDTLSYSITQPPTNGQLSQSGSIWLYQPDSDYSGNDSFSFTASDGELASQTAIVSISIKSINDKPVAVTDMLSMPSTQSNVYLLDLIANDIDIDGDELSIIKVGSNIGKAKIVNNRVEYTAEAGVQSQIKITYVISDPSKETAKAEAIVTIDNSANPLLPTLTLPADIEINAQQLFTKVDLGFATALDYLGEPAHVTRLTQGNHFSSGTHQIFWQATDSEGNKVTDSQILVIHPYLTFAENEQSAEDSNYQVRLSLSGQAPSYPLTIPYTVSGTSDTSDHSAIDAEIVIDKGTRAVIELTIYGDNETEVDETLVLTFAANTLGNKVYSLLITEGNIAPQISTEVQQAGQKRHIIVTNSDLVTISTDVFDANSQDSHSYQWMPVSSAVVNTSNQDSVFEFSPAGLIAGLYPITLTVTDDAATALSSQQTIYLELVTALPVLTDADSDGDLIPDSYEGIGDSDNDGIPDYQDGVLPCHIMPEQVPMQQQFLAQGQSDICLRKGLQSSDNSSGGLLLTDEEVEIKLGSDTNVENIGGVFDFILFGLPQVGGTYDIAIPQQLPLPENPIYRKFIQGNWQNFIQDNNNQLASSLGEAGHCPAPNDPSWVTGLTQGHWCVKLSIQDGGPNDNDGIANGSIVDPGGVGVARSSNILPVANPDNITMQANTAELIDVLANDIDANGDQLTILGASTNIGTVAIENNQLRYSTETDHYGELIVNYNIDDNNGGTAHTTVVVNVIANSAPLAIDDTLNTDDQQVVEIDVLANDSDKESSIDLISATAEVGSVEITANQMLRYTPVEGFEGLDTIDYTITDEHGAQSQAQVMIMVTAAKEITIQNKASSGGSIGGLILILGAFVFIARSRLGLLLLSLIGFNSVASDWSIETELGQSWADYSSQQSIPSGELISYDKSDFSWSLGVGYLIAPRWQLSARYIDMGQSSAQIQATTTLPTELQYNTPVLAKGAGVDIAYSFWQSERFSASASLGAIYWQQELSSEILDSPSSKISSDSDHLDAYFGLNIKYQLSANWHTGIKATRYDLEANSVDNLYLMLGYRF